MSKYDHKKIEKKWKKNWEASGIYKTQESEDKPKYYVLDMFPYPSGAGLHVGHPKGYIATDIVARMKMMQGYNVLHPMGWDAFGLPTENYALKNKVHPSVATAENIKTFKKQLGLLGFTYDWDREVNTTDPAYYKWTQWAFLQMFKKGLVHESYEPINWCPECKTGLANEDLEGGLCERCGSEIEKKPMRQWVIKITDYAERLLADLEKLSGWPESIKTMQKEWIGKSEGALVQFPISNFQFPMEVFTTRPDTLFGVTYLVLAPEHAIISKIKNQISNIKEVEEYIKKAKKKSDKDRADATKEKTGVELKGVKAVNPVNGGELPIFVADYVLAGYGTGAIMAVPAHDERDFAFAEKFNLPIREVIMPSLVDHTNPPREGKENTKRNIILAVLYDPKNDKYLTLKWRKQPWRTFVTGGIEEGENAEESAKREITEETGYADVRFVCSLGQNETFFFAAHKDVNRQVHVKHFLFELVDETRVPISNEEKEQYDEEWMTFEEICSAAMQHVEKDLILGRIKEGDNAYLGSGVMINSGEFDGMKNESAGQIIVTGLDKQGLAKKKIMYKLRDWVFSRQRYWGEPIPLVHCEKDGWVPLPESELPLELPKVKNYEPSGTGESPLANIEKWVNTKCPMCGGPAKRETNTMPQWAGSCWYYLRYIDPKNDKALVDKEKEKYWSPVDLYVGGAEHATRHLIYARFWHKFLYDIGAVAYEEPFTRLQNVGLILAEDGRKMSKRWGNVINPDDVVDQFGADSMRLYEMFMGPFDQPCAWSTNGLIGTRRFLEKVWALQEKVKDHDSALDTVLHQTIKKVTEDIEKMHYNTAIAQMMILANEMSQVESLSSAQYSLFIQLLAPFAPHIAEELWGQLGHKNSIFVEAWPKYNPELAKDKEITLAIQINGKLRDTLTVSPDISEEDAKTMALASEKIQKWLEGKPPKKVIYIKGKLISIVI